MRGWLLAALLLAPIVPFATADPADPWWDERWRFRLPITIGPQAFDPMTGSTVAIDGIEAPLVLVPIDLTAALRTAGSWPFDAAGRPVGWTFSPESVRVVERGTMAPIPARFLAYTFGASPPFEASANAAGTLALLVHGRIASPRVFYVYFAVDEHASTPADTLSALAAARIGEVGGLGPFVSTLAHIPPTTASQAPALLLFPAGEGATRATVSRLAPGTGVEEIASPEVAAEGSRVDLPPSERGYDARIVADRPVLAIITATGAPNAAPTAAFFHASLDGSAAGHRFVLPAGATYDIIGTAARTEVRVGASTLTVGRLSSVASQTTETTRVEASAPVLVLQRGSSTSDGDAYLHVARALTGAPAGPLLVAGRAAGHAVVSDASATVQAFPLARPQEIASARVGEPAGRAWVARSPGGGSAEPWAFSASGATISALLGSDGYAVLGGADAMRFQYAIAATRPAERAPVAPLGGRILAPFQETDVTLDARALNGTLLASASTTLPAAGALGSFPDGSRELAAESTVQSIRASKPVFASVWRAGAPLAAALPGLPPAIQPDVGQLEHFGALLVWSESSSQIAARPGETARATLTLANLGRARTGEPLVESVALDARIVASPRCQASWEATLPQPSLDAFTAPGERGVDVLVTLPPDAAAGECVEIDITATSSVETEARSTTRVMVKARSGFVPELRIVRTDGTLATAVAVTAEPGVATSAGLQVRNLGGESGRVLLAHASGPGYASALRAAWNEGTLRELTLAPDETAFLRLEIVAPTGQEPPWDFYVQATSAADPSAREEVVVSVTPRANVSLVATPDERRLTPILGAHATTRVRVENLGGDVEVRARLATSPPEGWDVRVTPERLLLRAVGTRGDLDARLDAGDLNVTVTAPRGARVGEVVSFALALDAAGSSLRVPMSASAVNDFALGVGRMMLVTASPGVTGATALTLRSQEAAGAMNVTLISLQAPRGWTASLTPRALPLAPNDSAILTLRYEVLPGAPPGEGVLRAVFALTDGISAEREFTIDVPTATLEAASLHLNASPTRLVLADGARGAVVFTLRNDGNIRASGRSVTDGAISLVRDPAFSLAPGEEITFDALVGPDEGTATLRALGAVAAVEVARASRDLRIANATARTLADGTRVVDVELANVGTTSAPALTLRVRSDAGVVSEQRIGALAAGATARHVLAVPPEGALHVEAESADAAADATPEDNVAEIASVASAARETPAAGAALALVLVFALAFARRRR